MQHLDENIGECNKKHNNSSYIFIVLVEGEEPVVTAVVRPPPYGPPPPFNAQQNITPEYANNYQPGPHSDGNQQYPDSNYGTIYVTTEQAYNPPTTIVTQVEYQKPPRIKTYYHLNVFATTLFFINPLGIIGMVTARKCKKAKRKREYDKAKELSKKAKHYGLLALLTSLVAWVMATIIIVSVT